MREYEFALIFNEEVGKEQALKKVKSLLEKVKGKLKKQSVVGVRQMAYPIKKQTKGWYGFFVVELEENSISELDRIIKLEEKILRYLLVRA